MIDMALSFMAKLILSGKLKFEDGSIRLKDTYLTLAPSLFISEIIKNYFETGRGYILYLLSWIGGFLTVRSVIKLFNATTPEQIYNIGMNLGESIGIGLYKTHDYFPGRYTHFIINNNPFSKWFGKSDHPMDFYISGAMVGGGCFVHNALCQNVELKCIAKGDLYCEFLTGTEKELKSRGLWDIAKERYRLDDILPIQRYAYNNVGKRQDLDEFMLDVFSKVENLL